MLFRLLLLLALAGALAVFTLQNLTPLLPLVFFGLRFPALPLAWWVLGAIAAGALSMLSIQILFGLSNFVTGQTVRSRVRATANRTETPTEPNRWTNPAAAESVNRGGREAPRRDRATTTDDSAWQDWRGYESPSSQSASPRTPSPRPPVSDPGDDWERPASEDWEGTARQDGPRRATEGRVSADDLKNFEADQSPRRGTRSGSTYSYGYREPQDTGAGKPEPVVDADYRVIVPPYQPVAEYTPPPPPPPPAEENADDWFEETSDEFGQPDVK
ncbi:MAG: hypothetical protein NW220_16790 [Leptolyngbyaceae cyanobacterium bins.349]|nr:hypothetical protein [Leptolyngbyaceae cyanobacterium bins.349]